MPAVKKEITKKKKNQTPFGVAASSKSVKKTSWQNVKIKGHLISNDTEGYEGLIGLEVLKTYDRNLVKIEKANRGSRKRQEQNVKTQKKHKGKKTAFSDDAADSLDEKVVDNKGTNKKKLTRKEKFAQRKQQKLEKQKAKREKRKAERKNQNFNKENGKKHKKELNVANNNDDEYPPDRFALLRPPADTNSDETEHEIDPISGLDTYKLKDWIGLGIPPAILRAISEKGFEKPTEIQALTLPAAILGKKDILGAAETGSGKTLAFGIPVLAGIMELKAKNSSSGIRKPQKQKAQETNDQSHEDTEEREITPPPEELEHFPNISDNTGNSDSSSESETDNDEEAEDDKKQVIQAPLYAVVLTPTRELAVQIKNHLTTIAKYTGIKIATVFGGLSAAKQERILKKCPEIVVATPGRFWELYQLENSHLSKIVDISFLVIDETDRMVEKGHFEELQSLLKIINANEDKKQTRQNFVFSATLTLVHDLPEHMQRRNSQKQRSRFIKQTPGLKLQNFIDELGISDPKIVDITRSQQTAQKLMESRLICPIDHKDYYLYYFVQHHPGRTIVFCNSIDCVKRLATLFNFLNCNALPLHANMIQKQRLKNLERFCDDPHGLLIATDVAARGLDIPNVEHVIHYQVPRTSENYVHRSGRTARANKDGITVMFMEPGEVKNYVKLYKTLDRTEDLPLFPISERYIPAVKERVNLAREVDKEELKLKRTQSEIGWMKKQANEMDMIIDGFNDKSDSDDDDEDPFVIEKRQNRIRLANMRANLKRLLAKPIFPKGFSFKYPTSTGHLEMPEICGIDDKSTEANSAIKAMHAAIEDMKQAKIMRNKKRKFN